MDAGYNIGLLTLTRFGMWGRILGMDEEDDYPQPTAENCPLAAALRHYARGLAFAAMVRAVDLLPGVVPALFFRSVLADIMHYGVRVCDNHAQCRRAKRPRQRQRSVN